MSETEKYLGILQIGPVQEFIQAAKKTVDYWSGSFILSYLCAVAVDDIIKRSRVIFPFVEGNPLYNHATKHSLPWTGTADDDVYRPSLPNRLFCRLEGNEDPGAVLSHAKDQIARQWGDIQNAITSALASQIRGLNDTWRTIWDRQVKNPFEILYVWLQWPADPIHYKEMYRRTEALMGYRKASRWFASQEPEPGHKCTLCGLREALHLANGDATRKQIRDDWENKVRAVGKLKWNFRTGEALCAVCTIKRLAPEYVFRKAADTPSTSTVAVSRTVHDLLANRAVLGGKIRTFEDGVKHLARGVGEPPESEPVPKNQQTDRLLCIDGDWLQESFYQKLRHQVKEQENVPQEERQLLLTRIESVHESCSSLLGELDKTKRNRNEICLPPAKYFAVLAADGDNMGERLADVRDEKAHWILSRRLADFAVKHAVGVFEKDNLGYTIYFGGDEGVAFLALEDLLKAMRELHGAWEKEVVVPLQTEDIKCPTLSVGVAIAHHQDGLRGTIESAHKAIESAKELHGKDGFCIVLDRRSGGTLTCRSKWTLGPISIIEILEMLVKAYRTEKILSADWIDDLRAEKQAVGDPAENHATPQIIHAAASLCENEIVRLMRRHTTDERHVAEVNQLAAMLITLNRQLIHTTVGQPNMHRFQDFINLMDVAHYVAKGGGR